jgi:hypothetical protein
MDFNSLDNFLEAISEQPVFMQVLAHSDEFQQYLNPILASDPSSARDTLFNQTEEYAQNRREYVQSFLTENNSMLAPLSALTAQYSNSYEVGSIASAAVSMADFSSGGGEGAVDRGELLSTESAANPGVRRNRLLDALSGYPDTYTYETKTVKGNFKTEFQNEVLTLVRDENGVPIFPDSVWDEVFNELTKDYVFKSKATSESSDVGFTKTIVPRVKGTGFLRARDEKGKFTTGGNIRQDVVTILKRFVYTNWIDMDTTEDDEGRTGTLKRGLIDAKVEYDAPPEQAGFNLFGKYKFVLPDIDRPERPNQPWGGNVPLRFYAPIVFRGRGPILAKKGDISGMTFMYKGILMKGSLAVGPAEPKNPFILTGPQISELSKLMGALVVKEAQ